MAEIRKKISMDPEATIRRLRAQLDAARRWVPCPDHRDKTENGRCYVCGNESRRAALAAAERERDEAREQEEGFWLELYDDVLHQRGPLADNGMTGEQINDVLGMIAEYLPAPQTPSEGGTDG